MAFTYAINLSADVVLKTTNLKKREGHENQMVTWLFSLFSSTPVIPVVANGTSHCYQELLEPRRESETHGYRLNVTYRSKDSGQHLFAKELLFLDLSEKKRNR